MAEYSKELSDTIASVVEGFDKSYSFNEEKGVFALQVEYENVLYHIHIYVYKERILFDTILPFRCPEKKKYEFAVLKSYLDYRIIMGALNYDISDGEIGFETHLFCGDSLPSVQTIKVHLYAGVVILGDYLNSIIELLFSDKNAVDVIEALE